MPRNVSLSALQAAMAPETDAVYLVLLELNHSSWSTPVRLVDNREDITSNSNVYQAFPFQITMPDDSEDREPSARIVIDNVDRSLIEAIRTTHGPIDCTVSVITDQAPNSVEWGPLSLQIRGITYNAQTIEGNLTYSAFTSEPFPYRTFDPTLFPGLFT